MASKLPCKMLNFRYASSCLLLKDIQLHICLNARIACKRWISCSQPNVNEFLINVQDAYDFRERVLKSPKPVIVVFHANWCAPCKLLGPRLEMLVSAEFGEVVMAKVNVDKNQELVDRFDVSVTPTVIAMKDGKVMDSFEGKKDHDQLHCFVRKLLGK